MKMASSSLFYSLLLVFHLLLINHPSTTVTAGAATTTTLYFSKTTFFSDYQKMLTNLKIFIYPPPFQQLEKDNNTSTCSLFYNSLLSSPFITNNSNDAVLFFIPFPPLSTRSLARHLQFIRTSYHHWSASLGADHFFFSCNGVGRTSTRDVVELKKNAIRISCFPSPAREFIPHKDITFPPTLIHPRAAQVEDYSTRLLGYSRFTATQSDVELINGLRSHEDFMIESEPSDEVVQLERVQSSKFCLFVYDEGEGMVGLSVALAHGCVSVVITDRPIQDLPLMDLIRWAEIALFVKSNVKPDELKSALINTYENGAYEKMRGLGVAAAQHFAWNKSSPQPYDAFHMVIYQLWRRRHAIRYATWQVESL